MDDWVTNFGVQISFEALIPTKAGYCEILPPSPAGGESRRQKHDFEHNLAQNYLTMTKLHMGQLDLNTKKTIFSDFGIFDFKEGKWLNFGKTKFSNVTGH